MSVDAYIYVWVKTSSSSSSTTTAPANKYHYYWSEIIIIVRICIAYLCTNSPVSMLHADIIFVDVAVDGAMKASISLSCVCTSRTHLLSFFGHGIWCYCSFSWIERRTNCDVVMHTRTNQKFCMKMFKSNDLIERICRRISIELANVNWKSNFV